MQTEPTTNEQGIRPRGKTAPSENCLPMLQAMKHIQPRCYIPRKHTKINRQSRRLEITITPTKQTPAPQINRQLSATSSITNLAFPNSHNSIPALRTANRAPHVTNQDSQIANHRPSNRHTPLLENAVSHRKQTVDSLSNRHFLQSSASRQRQIADPDRPPHNVSNRQWQILENDVNLSKQTSAPRSNRHKNAIFSSTKSRTTTRAMNHDSRITALAVCACVQPMREYLHAKNTK